MARKRKRPLQEWIMQQLAEPGVLYVVLRCETHSRTTSMIRAARSLQSEKRVVVARLVDDKKCIYCIAALPGAVFPSGTTIEEISAWIPLMSDGRMRRVAGSFRDIAKKLDISPTSAHRYVKQKQSPDVAGVPSGTPAT